MYRIAAIGCVVGFSALAGPSAALALTESWDPVTGTESVSYSASDSLPDGVGPVLSVDGTADQACQYYCSVHSDVKHIVITSSKTTSVSIATGGRLNRSTGNVSVDVYLVAGASVDELWVGDDPQARPDTVSEYSLFATSDGFDFNGDGISDFTLHAPSISVLITSGGSLVPDHIDLHKWSIPIIYHRNPNYDPGPTIVGSKFDDVLIGTPYRDTIEGGGGNDKISGMAGNDDLNAGAGNDWVSGGAGNDVITGENGDDTIFGGAGNDFIWANLGNIEPSESEGQGNDTIYGGPGNDGVVGGGGFTRVHLGSGNDGFSSNRGSAAVWGDAGKDRITFCGCYHRTKRDRAYGGAGSDWLLGIVPRIHKSFERINFQH